MGMTLVQVRAARALLMGGTMLENRAEELILLAGLADPDYEARLREKFNDGSTAHHRADEFRHALGNFYLRRNQGKVLEELPGVVFTEELVTVGQAEDLKYREALKRRNSNGARIALAAGAGDKSEKTNYLRVIVRECKAEDRKMLIFAEFLDVLDTAARVIGDECLVIHGKIRDNKRPDIMESFQHAVLRRHGYTWKVQLGRTPGWLDMIAFFSNQLDIEVNTDRVQHIRNLRHTLTHPVGERPN
jgi:hypothetical protein